LLSFGPRSTLGLFLTPQSQANGWDRNVFGLAIAIQNIVWGIGQPFAGMLADRFGTIRVLCAGGIFYAIGLAMMAYSTTPAMLDLSAGVFIGFGLAGSSFSIVISAFGKLLPERWRSLAFGGGAAAGSFGQFLYAPVTVSLMGAVGWQETLVIFAVVMLLVLPLSLALSTSAAGQGAQGAHAQSLQQALTEAIGHRSYVLLVLGFFTCGFQLAFITVHMPAYLVDRGLSADVGGWPIG
jgi:MFS family permease